MKPPIDWVPAKGDTSAETLARFRRKTARIESLLVYSKHRVTDYALSCGHIQRHRSKTGITTELWSEFGCYHVRQHSEHEGRVFWDSLDSIGKARNRFNEAIKGLTDAST